MNAQQRHQNRRTARLLAQEVFEANLPDGLYMTKGRLTYNCEGCERECEWYGTPEEFEDPDAIKLGGCTQWCLP